MNLSKIKDDGERMNCKIDNFLPVRGLAWYWAYYVWSKWPWESFFFLIWGPKFLWPLFRRLYLEITKCHNNENMYYTKSNL